MNGWVSPSGIVYEYDHECSTCNIALTRLEVFPNGLCVDCFEKTQTSMPTAADIVGLFTSAVKR